MDIGMEKASLCALGRIFGFEPKTGLSILSHLGSAGKIFAMHREEVDGLLGPFSRHRMEITPKAVEDAMKELHDLEKKGIMYIGYTDEDYPPLLKECEDAPIGIYVRSESPAWSLWKQERSIAVVGTRDISQYGSEWCHKIIRALSESGSAPLIISGLALGTDIIAHKTALEYGLPTIAVMATGPESVYPYRHTSVAERIARTPGCALITDYPPGTAPLALHFLRRNRIIAGAAHSTILVESKVKGGGMTTARLAFSYDREVYALPGRNDDIRSQGCNLLIREKVAEPLISIEDLAESLGLKYCTKDRTDILDSHLRSLYGDSLPDHAKAAVSIIRRQRNISVEEIAEMTQMTYAKTSEICRILESDGILTIDLLQRCSINPKFI